jgi:hypothetical protein
LALMEKKAAAWTVASIEPIRPAVLALMNLL